MEYSVSGQLSDAFRNNDLKLIQDVIKHNDLRINDIMNNLQYPVKAGNLEIIKWVFYKFPEGFVTLDVLNDLISQKNLDIHDLYHNRPVICNCKSAAIYELAAKNGHIHILQWLRDNNIPCVGIGHLLEICMGHFNIENVGVQIPGPCDEFSYKALQWLSKNNLLIHIDDYTAELTHITEDILDETISKAKQKWYDRYYGY